MRTHIGRGVGKYIEEELFNSKEYVKICSPNISYSLCKKLFELLNNGVRVQVITSDIITGDKNSKQANSLAKEITQKLQKENNSKKPNLEYKIISTYDIPLIHAKIFVIDGKCAIMGSANFSENSFQNFAEYILVAKDDDLMVKKIEKDFDILWREVEPLPNQLTKKSIKGFMRDFRKKL